MYFEEDSGVEYVYKEPKVTSLAEVSERLYHQYCEKFGHEVVKIIMDSAPVSENRLHFNRNFILFYSNSYFAQFQYVTS